MYCQRCARFWTTASAHIKTLAPKEAGCHLTVVAEVSEGPLGSTTGQFSIRVWHTRRDNIIFAGFRPVTLPPRLSGCPVHREKAGQQRGLWADRGARDRGPEQRPPLCLSLINLTLRHRSPSGGKLFLNISFCSFTKDGEGKFL